MQSREMSNVASRLAKFTYPDQTTTVEAGSGSTLVCLCFPLLVFHVIAIIFFYRKK